MRDDTGSRTEADAGRYAATHAHDVDRPGIDEVTENDARLPRAVPGGVCGDCGQAVVHPDWCVTCAEDIAAEMRQRNEEWWR